MRTFLSNCLSSLPTAQKCIHFRELIFKEAWALTEGDILGGVALVVCKSAEVEGENGGCGMLSSVYLTTLLPTTSLIGGSLQHKGRERLRHIELNLRKM